MLFAVTIREVICQVRFQLTVVGVDGGSHRSLGGVAFAEALQNALNVAHAVGLLYIGHCCERFRVGNISLSAGEIHEACFERIQGNLLLRLQDEGELMPVCAEAFGFQHLRNAFMQPGRAASGRKLVDE